MTTNEGSRSRMTSVPQTAPIAAVAAMPPRMATHHGSPWVVEQDGRDGAADAGHVADRQVDLPEHQHPDLGHAQQDEHRALDQEVDQVPGGQEDRVLDLEDDDEEDEAAEDGEHAALATADPLADHPDVLAQRSAQFGECGLGHRSVVVRLDRCRARDVGPQRAGALGRALLLVGRHGFSLPCRS